jgi:hypothetical protein
MKKMLLILAAVVMLAPGCCAVNKRALDVNLKAWKVVGEDYRNYVNNDDSLDADEKEDLLIVVDEGISHAEEMVKTIGGGK